MWENFVPGFSPARIIYISDEMADAINKWKKDTGLSTQYLFDSGLLELVRIWGGGEMSFIQKDEDAVEKVRNIFEFNRMPGKINRDRYMAIKINGDRSYNWLVHLEEIGIIHCFNKAVRRIISWQLKKKGYI